MLLILQCNKSNYINNYKKSNYSKNSNNYSNNSSNSNNYSNKIGIIVYISNNNIK